MLVLYFRPTCPYCHKVLDAAKALHIGFALKDIGNPSCAAELVNRGGKQQVPYLVDEEARISMYESDDIIRYLGETHGPR